MPHGVGCLPGAGWIAWLRAVLSRETHTGPDGACGAMPGKGIP